MTLIEGRYAFVREMEEEDASIVVEWRNSTDVARWLVQWKPLSVEEHLAWFKAARLRDVLMMFCTRNGQAIGTASFYGFDHKRTCAEWGRVCSVRETSKFLGVVECCYLAHRLAFEQLGLCRLHCACAADNMSSIRFNVRLGYVQEGYRRKHLLTADGYRDVVEWGMFPDEFLKAQVVLEKLLYRE
jgi:RimJ/RimL family protein N-acetyltransferase